MHERVDQRKAVFLSVHCNIKRVSDTVTLVVLVDEILMKTDSASFPQS